jgi:hypothetical protein
MVRLNRVFTIICFFVALAILLIEGILMLFSSLGPSFPSPHIETALHVTWWVLLLGTLVFFKKALPTLVLGWVFLLLSTYLWWHITDERSGVWFLYQNSLPMGFVLFSHLAALGSKSNSSPVVQ